MHVDDEDKLMHQISASGQNRNMVIINESGIYALIFGSKLKSAKRFKHWITSEVLPRYLAGYEVKSSQKVHILKFSYLKINLVKQICQTVLNLRQLNCGLVKKNGSTTRFTSILQGAMMRKNRKEVEKDAKSSTD